MAGQTIAEVIREKVAEKLKAFKVSIPCFITAIDANRTYCTVQIAMETDETSAKDYQVQNVPIRREAASEDAFLYMPVNIGSVGALIVCDTDIQQFLYSDGTQSKKTKEVRTHDINDSYFLPGISVFQKAITPTDLTAVELKNDQIRLTLHTNGKIAIEANSKDLIKLINDGFSEISDAINNAANGLSKTALSNCANGAPLSNSIDIGNAAASLLLNKTDLDAIITNLETFEE